MVPCIHQRNLYIKRKVGVWIALKCIALVGGKNTLTFAGLQTTQSHVSLYRAEIGNLRKSGSTFHHITCLHQSSVYIKRKLQVWAVQNWIPLVGAKTPLTCVGLQTTPSHVSQYRA